MAVKEVIRKHKPRIVMLQKTKNQHMSDRVVKEIWGGSHLKWLRLDAVGATSGVILLWDIRQISVASMWKGVFSVSAVVEDLVAKFRWLVTSVYGPNDSSSKREFWRELDDTRGRWNGAWCVKGDWNVVKFLSERSEGRGLSLEMRLFLDWLNSHSFVDLQLSGATFTW